MAEPEISLSPSEGHQRDQVVVTGSGFERTSTVKITFDGQFIEKTVSGKGQIYKEFRVPLSRHGEVTVTATDNEGNSASALFTVINEVPTAKNDRLSVNEDEQISITLSASDPNSDVLTYAISREPASGALTGFNAESGTVTYAPEPNFSGSDSFEFFASDGLDESARATVSIAVAPVNDSPIAQSSSATVDEDGDVGIALAGSDPDGDPLAFSVSDGPKHGTLSGTPPSITYTPAPGYSGSDSFSFVAYDGSQYSGSAAVSIMVLAVDRPPSAADVQVETEEDEAVTIRLSAADSDDVSFDVESAPSHGSLGSIEKTGPLTAEVSYRPQRDYHGTDSFTFTASDGEFESDSATVKIDIEPVNDAPEAQSQNVTAEAGKSVEITLRGTDVEGDDLEFLIVHGARQGTLGSISSGNDRAVITYTPDSDEDGQDRFTFRVSDGDLESNTADVTIVIRAQATEEEIVTPRVRDQIVAEDSIVSGIQLHGGDASSEEAILPQSPAPDSPAAETLVEVPLPQTRPDDVVQGAALQSLSTAGVESAPASSSVIWVIPGVLVGIASLVAFLGYREKGLARGALAIPEKALGLLARAGLVKPDPYLGHSVDQPEFSGPMNRIYKILNDERCRAARKQIFDVQYARVSADPKEYRASKALAKKQFEQIGSILQSRPELQEPYFESFGEITLKVWWAIKEDVSIDERRGMRWDSLEWLASETEKYWARQNSNSKTP